MFCSFYHKNVVFVCATEADVISHLVTWSVVLSKRRHDFILLLTQVFSASPWRDCPAQETQTQEYCPVPGFSQSGWVHQDLHGRSTRRYPPPPTPWFKMSNMPCQDAFEDSCCDHATVFEMMSLNKGNLIQFSVLSKIVFEEIYFKEGHFFVNNKGYDWKGGECIPFSNLSQLNW